MLTYFVNGRTWKENVDWFIFMSKSKGVTLLHFSDWMRLSCVCTVLECTADREWCGDMKNFRREGVTGFSLSVLN